MSRALAGFRWFLMVASVCVTVGCHPMGPKSLWTGGSGRARDMGDVAVITYADQRLAVLYAGSVLRDLAAMFPGVGRGENPRDHVEPRPEGATEIIFHWRNGTLQTVFVADGAWRFSGHTVWQPLDAGVDPLLSRVYAAKLNEHRRKVHESTTRRRR